MSEIDITESHTMLPKWLTRKSCWLWLWLFYARDEENGKEYEKFALEKQWLQQRWEKGAFQQLTEELRLEDELNY